MHLQITHFFFQHVDLFDELVVRLLHHSQLLLQAVALSTLAFSFHVLLAHLDLQLADVLAVLLKLVFHVHPLLEQLLVFLLQVEFNNPSIFKFHFLRLNFSHLVEHFIFLVCLI